MKPGRLYLFPTPLAPVAPAEVLPQGNIDLIRTVRYFVVEELRTARRFLKSCDRAIDIDALHFDVLNEHTPAAEVEGMLVPLLEGHDVGLLSEAGCPAVADPGSDLVALAQRRGIEVVPLVGPSSILMSLMASGFNGQSFAFVGYLPYEASRRADTFRRMERDIRQRAQTQIFIETPYRNNKLIAELCRAFDGNMLLCVACDITGPGQTIVTRSLRQWATATVDYDKRPAIFLLYQP